MASISFCNLSSLLSTVHRYDFITSYSLGSQLLFFPPFSFLACTLKSYSITGAGFIVYHLYKRITLIKWLLKSWHWKFLWVSLSGWAQWSRLMSRKLNTNIHTTNIVWLILILCLGDIPGQTSAVWCTFFGRSHLYEVTCSGRSHLHDLHAQENAPSSQTSVHPFLYSNNSIVIVIHGLLGSASNRHLYMSVTRLT